MLCKASSMSVFCQGPPAVVSGDQATEPYMSKVVRVHLIWDLGQERASKQAQHDMIGRFRGSGHAFGATPT